jgi:hypothetical protein
VAVSSTPDPLPCTADIPDASQQPSPRGSAAPRSCGIPNALCSVRPRGELKLNLDKSNNTVTYQLTYSDLTLTATMAHIHFGKVHVPCDILIWLCQTATKPGPSGDPDMSGAGRNRYGHDYGQQRPGDSNTECDGWRRFVDNTAGWLE